MPSLRTMGALIACVAVAGGSIGIRIDGDDWQTAEMAVVPPYVPHQVSSGARLVNVLKIETETLDWAALPEVLKCRGFVHALAFVQLVRQRQRELAVQGGAIDLLSLDFDQAFFGAALAPRAIDRRIAAVIERIKRDPSAPAVAEECAETAHLSFSRFLHLFIQKVRASLRNFRTWKRARSLLHHVNREANLADIALDTGYSESTHFSHSIRQIYGHKPRDILAGSRRLAMYDDAPPPRAATGGR